jgi:hypothetical protein
MHQWPLRRAALQHFEVVANGGKGPEVTTDTKGGNRSFAAFAKQRFVSPKAAIDASDYIYR